MKEIIMSDKPLTLEDVLQFPCPFTIKIMGTNVPELISEVCAIVGSKSAGFNPQEDITTKLSRNGNYLSVNATIQAESRKQLDEIYLELNNHDLVKITL